MPGDTDARGDGPATGDAPVTADGPATSAATVLGIDAGGSSTRWLLLDLAGEVVAQGRVGPVSAIELGSERTQANLAALLDEVAAVARPQRVVAGVTGLDTGSPQARLLAAHLCERLGLDEGAATVLGDVVTAYLSAFEPGGGVLVYAGTGSVAVHVAHDGSIVRAGGHGYLIDDAGGGYWIGREALKRLLRAADAAGAPPTGKLASAVFGALGGSDWPTVREAVYGGGRARARPPGHGRLRPPRPGDACRAGRRRGGRRAGFGRAHAAGPAGRHAADRVEGAARRRRRRAGAPAGHRRAHAPGGVAGRVTLACPLPGRAHSRLPAAASAGGPRRAGRSRPPLADPRR